jgi:hypothetical protein
VGPAEISAYDPIAVPINVGWVCMSGMAPFCPMTQIGSSAPVTVAPTVKISGPNGVPINGSAQFTVQIQPASAVILSLQTSSGSGSAKFDDGTTSKTVSAATQTVTVKGVSASSAVGNIQLSAAQTQGGTVLGSANMSVVSVAITVRTSGPPSPDNAAGYRYSGIVGSNNLGSNVEPSSPQKCVEGVEFDGAVTPSGYTGTVMLLRNIVGDSQFSGAGGSTAVTPPPLGADDSAPRNRDDNSQSLGAFDLDAPGIGTANPSNVVRVRLNFLEYAVLASDSSRAQIGTLNWYSRSSCKLDPNDPTNTTAVFSNDVAGDNQTGGGTTNLGWNLQ